LFIFIPGHRPRLKWQRIFFWTALFWLSMFKKWCHPLHLEISFIFNREKQTLFFFYEFKIRITYILHFTENGIPLNLKIDFLFQSEAIFIGIIHHYSQKFLIPFDQIQYEATVFENSIIQKIQHQHENGIWIVPVKCFICYCGIYH
jgi:hypothetical protein